VTILLVDDDHDLVDLLSFVLERAGLDSVAAYDPDQAMHRLAGPGIDLTVVDVNLGQRDGFHLLEEIRRSSDIPVIMLTARDSEEDIVHGLELGADDYITKPFRHRELVARVRNHLRKRAIVGETPTPRLAVGPISMDLVEHSAHHDGRPLALTVTEFRLLQYFLQNPGRALTTAEILRQVWDYEDGPASQAVARVAVHRLRRKLGDDAANPRFLVTLPGIGFRFDDPGE
jgi:DNA-binding response OmpR family regulator